MKAQARRQKRLWKKMFKSRFMAFVAVLLIVIVLLIYFFLFRSSPAVYEAIPYTAAIVDQLAMTNPNSTFIKSINKTLTSAGFTVDFCNYSQVTVDFYGQLPSKRYSIIVLRVHSGVGRYSGLTSLYTSENYSQWEHYWEQADKRVAAVEYVENGPKYFAITSNFVKASDICKNSVIIMMGCEGLNKTDLAKAYVEKGAKVYISWDRSVSPEHTDKATTQLISNIVSKNETIDEAVNNTMMTVGKDPNYHSMLKYYPLEAKNHVVVAHFAVGWKNHFLLVHEYYRVFSCNRESLAKIKTPKLQG